MHFHLKQRAQNIEESSQSCLEKEETFTMDWNTMSLVGKQLNVKISPNSTWSTLQWVKLIYDFLKSV